jgi:murein DD-endopeptidase MepM/ murein hydrolase activator NlpD
MPVNPATAKMALQIAQSLARSRAARRLLVAVVVLQVLALTVVLFLPAYLASVTAGSAQRVFSTRPGNCGADTTPEADDSSPPPKVADLTAAQVTVARTIYLTALGVGRTERWDLAETERAVLVALAVAMQESRMGAAAGIDRPNGDGDAGVFQQRTLPGWYGTLAQVRDVGYGARVFLRGKTVSTADVAAARANGSRPAGPAGYTIPGLKQVHGWQDMAITVAAQKVQRSAFPSAYAQHEQIARSLLAVFKDKVDPGSAEAMITGVSVMCGPTDAMSCPPSGSSAEAGLHPDALRVLRCIHKGWPQIAIFYGVGSRSIATSDHPGGNAVDTMIPDYQSPAGVALGDAIAHWLVANRKKLGVKYVIWNEHIWSVARQQQGWRLCGTAAGSCYNGPDDTAAHRNHVHISTFGDSAGGADPVVGGGGSGGPAVLPLTAQFRLTARFGQCSTLWSHCHTGLDFSTGGSGQPIRAVMGGRVVASGSCGCAYGRLTKVAVTGDLQLWYAHQSAQRVSVGDVVRTGQVIGAVGATGNTTGPHLHLEVRIKGSPIDPEVWLHKQGLLND